MQFKFYHGILEGICENISLLRVLEGNLEPMVGLEPTTCSLRKSYSTTELHRQGFNQLIIMYKPSAYSEILPYFDLVKRVAKMNFSNYTVYALKF